MRSVTQRVVGGQSYTLTYDAENHMTSVSGAATASFVYNGDGQRIVASEGVTTTVYLGNYFELAWNGQTAKAKKYYLAGTTRVAMRQGGAAPLLVLGDHLGSTSRVVNYDGSVIPADQLYAPWGENRFTNGSMPTQYQFTGQYRQAAIGLDYFNARWYDPYLNRWAQPDSIVPDSGDVLDWDRYSYARNSPLNFIDPTGHAPACADVDDPACDPATAQKSGTRIWQERAEDLGITFSGDASQWTTWRIMIVVRAALDVGRALAKVLNENTGSAFRAIGAFRAVFKQGINFTWGDEGAGSSCSGFKYGCTTSAKQINLKALNGEGRFDYDPSYAVSVHTKWWGMAEIIVA